MIDPDAKAVIAPELMPGERLLWAEQPQELPLNALGVMGTAVSGLFVIIGVITVSTNLLVGGNFASGVFMCVWTAIAVWNLHLFSGLLRGPASQSYALTDQRGIVVETMGRGRTATLGPQVLRSFERTGGTEIGTLSFGPNNSFGLMFQFIPKLPLNTFHKIAEPARVERLILQTFTGATP